MTAHRILAALFVFILTAGIYARARQFDFVMLDDHTHLHENPSLNPPTPEGVARLWRAPYKGLYIPLTYTLWAAQKAVADRFPEQAAGIFHTVNLLTHAANAVWVVVILQILGFSLGPAVAGALLFALHPVQVESAAWISGFKDLSSGFFFLAALAAALYSVRREGLRLPVYLLSLFLFTAASLCKPSTVVFAPVLFVLLKFQRGLTARAAVIYSLPYLALALPTLWLTRLAQPEAEMLFVTPLAGRPLVAADTWFFYLSKLLFPLQLAPDYSRSPKILLAHFWRYLAPLAVLLVLWFFSRRPRHWKIGAWLFTIPLLPVLGLVPFFFQFFSTVADRYLYLSLFGAAWLAAALLSQAKRPRFAYGTMGALLVFSSILTYRQIGYWKDDLALFTHARTVNPNSLMARNNLGSILERQGQIREAAQEYWEAARIAPDSPPALYNLGRSLGLLGKYNEAIWPLQDLIRLAPGLADGHYVLGYVYLKKKELETAKSYLTRAAELNPSDQRAFYHLGQLEAERAHWKEAALYFRRALDLNPQHPEAQAGERQARSHLK